jgi:YVTN family beta-propeller protein
MNPFQNQKRLSLALIGMALVAAGAVAFGANSFFFGKVGPQADGTGITPNNWVLSPAGLQLEVGDRPMGMSLSPDGRFLAVVNCGQGVQGLALVDTFTRRVTQTIPYPAPEALYVGVTWSADGKNLYASAGGNNKIRTYSFDAGRLSENSSIVLGDSSTPIFPSGLAASQDGKTLFVANNLANTVAAIDLASSRTQTNLKTIKFGSVASASDIGQMPYALQLSSDGKSLYVALENAKAVAVVDTASLKETARVEVGAHPSAMALSSDGKSLYVANTNANTVSVVDTTSNKVTSTLNLEPYAGAPAGSMPTALSLSPDNKTLYVAMAGENALAVVDILSGKVSGRIPTAWFPSAVAISKDGGFIFTTNMKGLGAGPNPQGPIPDKRNPSEQYIAAMARGTVSVIPTPDAKTLEMYSTTVARNNGLENTKGVLARAASTTPRAIPLRAGDPSPIKHVIYVLKENRTYDQMFGSLKEGNGEPSLELFGQDVAPNHRALALEFGLFDNFYADAEVSADGHNWTMGAIATQYTQRNWAANYSPRGRAYDFEMGSTASAPAGGYLFDHAKRAGLDYRSYGEFNDFASAAPNVKPTLFATALEGRMSATFPGYDMNISDQVRFEAWKKEFDGYVASGKLPQLSVVRLPRDHTNGTRVGSPIPAAYVADNDLALGKLVEAVSNSIYWKDTAIFVLEDDAQNGADHVDAHRMPAFAISAYSKRGVRDHTMYSTSSMLRTIELILGLSPMTQFDAASTPMIAAFQDTPNLAPYKAITPKQPLDTPNTILSYKAKLSNGLNLAKADAVDERVFNDIIWHAVKGENTPMPAIKMNVRANPINLEAQRTYRDWKRHEMKTANPNVKRVVENYSKAAGMTDPYANDQFSR